MIARRGGAGKEAGGDSTTVIMVGSSGNSNDVGYQRDDLTHPLLREDDNNLEMLKGHDNDLEAATADSNSNNNNKLLLEEMLESWCTPALHDLNRDLFASYNPKSELDRMYKAARTINERNMDNLRRAYVMGSSTTTTAQQSFNGAELPDHISTTTVPLYSKKDRIIGSCLLLYLLFGVASLVSLVYDLFGNIVLFVTGTGIIYGGFKCYHWLNRMEDDRRDKTALMSREKLRYIPPGSDRSWQIRPTRI